MALDGNSAGNIVFGAGDVFIDGVNVGATMDGNVLRWEINSTHPKFHGSRGGIVGMGWIDRFVIHLKVVFAELTIDNFINAFPGITSGSGAHTEYLNDWTPGCPNSSDYKDLVLFVEKCNDNALVIVLDNVLVTESDEVTFHDEGDVARLGMTFTAFYDVDSIDVAPFRIIAVDGPVPLLGLEEVGVFLTYEDGTGILV
jgi:hypothetical protein